MILHNKISKNKIWASVFLAQVFLFFILSKVLVAISWAELFFEIQKKTHQLLFAWLPFSFGDWFYVVLILALLYFIIKIFSKRNRKKAISKFLITLNILYFLYQIFWGLLYFQTPLIEKLPQEPPKIEEAKQLATKYLELCKTTRTKVKEDQNGVFTIQNLSSIENEILIQQQNLPSEINSKKPTNVNSFKSSLFQKVMSFSGIMGYYNPFSAEAQYNPHLPATQLPFTLAHESAHQLGYAREQEANFIGYLIGKNAKDEALKYSTEYFVLKNLLYAISQQDEEFVKQIIQNYSPEMKKDQMAERLFIEKHKGLLDAFFGFTNDLFLKSNQQEGSITYSYFIDLLIRYERNHP
ncbi:MAG: DUF3810 domain-containing protein [Cruoricaptor ignavus]|nr:DUF3810 domain-containing protein [Cruoricaptor ignavus]